MTTLKLKALGIPNYSLLFVLLTAAAACSVASAQTLTSLTSFNGSDGLNPSFGSLIADSSGNLFGTTPQGGAFNSGTVFEISKTSSGYASTPTTLVSFAYTNGAYPDGGLIADSNGNLFGTTAGGGTFSYGTVFEIPKTSSGYANVPTPLVNFNSTNGASPNAGLITDSNGNLFGTTAYGGASGVGTVFEITKASTTTGYANTPATLASFNSTNGAYPYASLIMDSNGNRFGTTTHGGASGIGTVFEITKASTTTGYANTPATLASFNSTNGAYPYAGLIADSNGNLFGTTAGGGASGVGAVFEISKTSSGYSNSPANLASFNITDGMSSYASLIMDGNGNLYGTTHTGGASNDGTVFEISKTTSGYASTPITVVSLNAHDGAESIAALIADDNGNLFGTAQFGGLYGFGTVFEVTGSGFVPLSKFAGTPGTPNCIGSSTSTLAHTYGGIARAASILGYNNVGALMSAEAHYCSR